ncbi:hypothetical protein F8388_021559 [Cannabis sativa]|uniref:CN hydrolase domain-containing protein n=1 Tax=Cannabis sativa TaxID=3483 RepID=A0A7J6G942_CANSA|nr:hypothetical protein F8388_021559 [Cannabis sativa]KAF4379483.1 hypothetical protein G4B88_024931 [Cannabis sativa]
MIQMTADNQSPARASSCSYMIWGHSTLVGPSGEIIATSGDQETVVVGEIDYSKIQQQSYLFTYTAHGIGTVQKEPPT